MEPTLEHRAAQPYAAIPIKASLREWGGVNALEEETLTWLRANGREPAGAPFFRYRVIGGMDERFELEVGFPVSTPITADGRVLAGSKPEGTYLVTVHEGHPDQIADTHLSLIRWAAAKGIQPAKEHDVWEAMFESYETDPEDEPDPANWRTEIAYLVRSTPS